jgi:Fe(3+) dicitrate transport protein
MNPSLNRTLLVCAAPVACVLTLTIANRVALAQPATPPTELERASSAPEANAANPANTQVLAEPTAPVAASAETSSEGSNKESADKNEPSSIDVRVTGPAIRNTGGSVHVMTDKQLQRFKHENPERLLLKVPGVYVRGEDGFGLRPNIGMRGAASDRSKKITLMEDGVLFAPAPYSAPAAYYFPIIARMRNIRVIKGPASVAYGPQTVGGAIDLVTAEIPATLGGMADVSYGMYGASKLHGRIGTSDERFGALIEAVHQGSTGFKTIDGQPDADTGFSRNEVMGKFAFTPDPMAKIRQDFGVKLTYSNEQSNETYLGLTDADFRASPYRRYVASANDTMKWHRVSAVLTHQARFSETFSTTITAYRHDLDRVWGKVNGFTGTDLPSVLRSPTGDNALYYDILRGQQRAPGQPWELLIGPNNRTFVSQGVQAKANWKVNTGPVKHVIEYGLRYHYDEVDRVHSQDAYAVDPSGPRRLARVTDYTTNEIAYTHAVALHASDAMEWGPLHVAPGIRAELIRSVLEDRLAGTKNGGSNQVLLPGVGGFVDVYKGLGVLLGVHRGFSPSPPGDATAKPESSVNYEAGARYSGRSIRAEVIGFYNDYSNFTNLCTFSSGCTGANVDRKFDAGKARILGAEAFLEGTFKISDKWSVPIHAAYTYTDARFQNDFSSQDPVFGKVKTGDEIPYVPIHQLSATAGIEHRQFALNLAGTYVGDMRELPGQGEPKPAELTDAYFLLDATAKYTPIPWFTVYVSGRNLLNQSYIASRRPFGARPGAPLMISSGVEIKL